MKINAIQCPNCGDIIYSRAHYDCRHCNCGDTYIDGGFDYTRVGSKYPTGVKNVKITVNATKKELFDDWNTSKDKYGLIKNLSTNYKEIYKEHLGEKYLKEDIKKSLKSGKPEPVWKGKNLFARFLDAIFVNAKKHPENLHTSDKVWDKEWIKLLDRPAKVIPGLKKLFKGETKMNKMEKSIKKGIQDIKEGKVTKVTNLDKFFAELGKKREEHLVYYFFHDIYWKVYHFIKGIPLNIRTFVQRGKRGWANSDTWGFDYYLTKVISEGVRNLKEHIHGMPRNLTEGQWIDILNKITYTFELAHRMSNDGLYLIKDKKQRIKWQKSLDEINKKHGNRDRCMTNKEIREYEEGWKLFKEYFFNLWD